MASIETLLIADRGEIARRIIRTAHTIGLRTAVVYAESDQNAPYLLEADVAVPLAGSSAIAPYLDQAQILTIARQVKADAIHPGYGFLSESAEFAEACMRAGFIWVGPPPAVIQRMSLKLAAKEVAHTAGIPVISSTVIAGDNVAAWERAACQSGYPLLVKTNAGGGGKGIRYVATPAHLARAITEVQQFAMHFSGDTTVFLERCLPAPQHIEIQIFADLYGNVVHLYERNCSIQRRYQKVIEEAPAQDIAPHLLQQMRAASVELARRIGYVGAGTVEYLVDGESFSFLEMNTRLQMEHPVTECITGLDLVQLQIQIASGEPLPMQQHQVHCYGHAIEARLYAEDPGAGFSRTTGYLQCFEPAGMTGVRYDSGVASGQMITHYALLAKVIAHAPARIEAASRLAQALTEMRLCGPRTNRNFLVATLKHPDFLAGEINTDFVNQHPELLH